VLTIPFSGKVFFGTTITIINLDTDATVTYRIVGDDQADIKSGLISISSPIARALIGKEEGDVVVVKVPAGDVEYEIDKVEHL
jgi:transcription elongation factor GreA